MSRRRRTVVAAMLLLPALVAAACSSSNGASTAGPTTSPTAGTTTSAPAGTTTSPPAGTTTSTAGSTTAGSAAFKVVQPGVLTIATELGNPGWVNGEDPAHLTGGVEYEMGLTFAKDLGLKPQFRNVSFTPLVSGAVSDYDIGMMTIFKTPAREKVNTYSDCYYTDPTGAIVRNGIPLTTLADAKKIRWGYVTGGYAGLIMQKLQPDQTAKSFQDGPTEYAALQSGAVDAIMDDLSSIAGRAEQPGLAGKTNVAAVFQIADSPAPCSAVQLPKNSPPQNVELINKSLAQMKSSGQIDAWVKQYLSPLVSKTYPVITVG